MAAFCCVPWSIVLTAVLISCRPIDCSREASAIASTWRLISCTSCSDRFERLAGLADQLHAGLDLGAGMR